MHSRSEIEAKERKLAARTAEMTVDLTAEILVALRVAWLVVKLVGRKGKMMVEKTVGNLVR
jgi:hypothetical protein